MSRPWRQWWARRPWQLTTCSIWSSWPSSRKTSSPKVQWDTTWQIPHLRQEINLYIITVPERSERNGSGRSGGRSVLLYSSSSKNSKKIKATNTSSLIRVLAPRCLREQERVWDPGHRLAADEDLPEGDAEEDSSEHLSWVLPARGQALAGGTDRPASPSAASIRVGGVSPQPFCQSVVRCDAVTVPSSCGLDTRSAHASAFTRRGRVGWGGGGVKHTTHGDVYSVNAQREEGGGQCVNWTNVKRVGDMSIIVLYLYS